MEKQDEIMIETKDLCKIYKVGKNEDFYALRDVNVQIPKGKLTILKGRSGSGKTTLLNALSALDEVSRGVVYFGGKQISGLKDGEKEAIRRKEMGYIFQAVALIPMMTAFENVDYALRLANYEGDRTARVKDCLRKVGLGERMYHFPSEMSGGEQQRVAIARAISHQPKVIFADEPTAELDTNTGIKVIKIFKDLIEQEGCTIVMTTHSVDLMQAADVLYEIEDGEIHV